MSSTCSSPASQQSSYSGYSSSYPLTPQTAITSPGSSVGGRSPKVKSSRTQYSPYSLKQRHLSPPTPTTTFDGFLSPNMAPTSSPSPSSTSQFDSAPSPGSMSGAAPPFTTFDHYPEYPAEFPSSSHSVRVPETLNQPSYIPSSGYPPVWSFYGPSPTSSPTTYNSDSSQFPASPTFSEHGYQPDSPAVDPFEYQLEDWYTADGQKVEFSAMALHCATM